MNTRTRTALQAMKAPSKNERAKQKMEIGRSIEAQKAAQTRRCSRRDRKMALQQDVDKLRKKLKHEENVHRALERAFTRPLGALPRLPPYLPPYTLELLAEVAVLEEEVVRLEEQVVNFRQSLYQEAVHISSSKKHSNIDNRIDFCDPSSTTIKAVQPKSSCRTNSESPATMPRFLPSIDDEDPHRVVHCSHHHANGKQPSWNREPKKLHTCSATLDDRRGKENQQHSNTVMNNKQSRRQVVASRNYPKRSANTQDKSMVEKQSNLSKLQPECREVHDRATQECSADGAGTVKEVESSGPNKISEEILKCLLSIFLRLSREPVQMESETMPGTTTRLDCSGSSSSTATSSCKVPIMNCAKDIEYSDPYGICSEFGERGIGPYKHLSEIGSSSIDLNRLISSGFLIQRLELLLGKLSSVDLRGLSHQQKLAFWINIYNSCMMHAFLEYGIPDSPQMVVALMQKAIINVSGCSLSALTIEHFILRLPYHTSSVYAESRGMKNIDTVTMRSVFGLDWPEPLVTFALSCGSWSSPAVRVYTAGNVEKELDDAKRDYLQAAVGINNNRLGIPKLLDWYLLDFAKDMGSLLDWICLQLPNVLRKEAVKCVERGRRDPLSKTIQILPYDFNFRYLLPAP